MSRLRLLFAVFLGLAAPGTGLGLTSNADEGIRLYITFSLLMGIALPARIESITSPLPFWMRFLLGVIFTWGIWAAIDVGNVIHRYRKNALLPKPGGPYPPALLWLARLFFLLGLASIPGIYFSQISLSQWLFIPLSWVTPLFVVIADRLLRRRAGWRIFTIILLVMSLVLPLYASARILRDGMGIFPSALHVFLIFGQIALILAALVVLFLTSTRAFFRQPNTAPGVVTS